MFIHHVWDRHNDPKHIELYNGDYNKKEKKLADEVILSGEHENLKGSGLCALKGCLEEVARLQADIKIVTVSLIQFVGVPTTTRQP